MTHSDWLNSAAGGDAAGNAMVMACNNWNRISQFVKKIGRILIFQSLALWDDPTSSSTDIEVFTWFAKNFLAEVKIVT